MKTCNCTLYITNPDACKSSSVMENDNIEIVTDGIYTVPYQNPQLEKRKIKRITKTIEKYDKKGNYKGKKVITEEEEIFDEDRYVYPTYPVYPTPYYPTYEDPIWVTSNDNKTTHYGTVISMTDVTGCNTWQNLN